MVVNLVSVIFKSIKMSNSFEISTKCNTKIPRKFFFSPQKSLKTLQLINKIKAWAYLSCFSRDTFGRLKICLFRQFCVQEFSADTNKNFTS